jgi:hypothetical protein
MKISSRASLTRPCEEWGWRMLPRPCPYLPVGGEIFPIYILVGRRKLPHLHPLMEEIPTGNQG